MHIKYQISDRAKVLAALYNASFPLGMGKLQYDPTPMTEKVASDLLKDQTHFDYLKGRIMKINLVKDQFGACWYDRDNGDNAALNALKAAGLDVEEVEV